jgi:hypothetical protein
LTDDLTDFARGARASGWQAAHIVPWGEFRNRTESVRKAISRTKAILDNAVDAMGNKNPIDLNGSWNGFWSPSRDHLGTHTNRFFLALEGRLRGLTLREDILDQLQAIREEVLLGLWTSK